ARRVRILELDELLITRRLESRRLSRRAAFDESAAPFFAVDRPRRLRSLELRVHGRRDRAAFRPAVRLAEPQDGDRHPIGARPFCECERQTERERPAQVGRNQSAHYLARAPLSEGCSKNLLSAQTSRALSPSNRIPMPRTCPSSVSIQRT